MDTESLKQDIVFDARLRGRAFVLHSTWGLFSPRRIDDGTAMLIEKMEINPADRVLDLGCGYGPIGLAAAASCPRGQVHMVDKDFVAVEYARGNAERNGLDNCSTYLSNAFSHVPEQERFHVVCSNIPAKVGKEMLAIILHDTWNRLVDGGRLYVVTIAGLRQFIKRNFREVFGNYKKVKQGKTYTVALAIKQPGDSAPS